MSSTNKTTHYELSQYVGSDKPTYLTDYNGDMAKIDAGIYGAKSLADVNESSIGDLTTLTTTAKSNLVSAVNEVDSDLGTLSTTVGNHTTAIADNTSDIGTLTNLTTTAKNNLVSAINEVDSNCDTNTSAIGNLTNLETTTKTNLVSAINEVNNNFTNFNLTNIQTISYTDMTVTGGTLTRGSLTIAKNSDDSIIKVYGNLHGNFTTNLVTITIPCTLSVDSSYDIFPAGMTSLNSSDGQKTFVNGQTLTLANNQLTCLFGGINGYEYDLLLFPCLYFNKDFGDLPNNN